jgi:CP family cyanate transporter-like MFS transporter
VKIVSPGLLLLALMLAAINLRPGITSLAPLIERIAAELSLSRGLIGLSTALPVLCMGLLAPFAPRLALRFGLERTVALCLGLIAGALLMRLAGESSVVLIGSAVVLGVGIALAGPLLSGFIKRHFVDRVGPVAAWYSLGMAVGGAAGAVLTVSVTQWLGDRWTYGLAIWALPALVALLLWLYLARRVNSLQPAASRESPAHAESNEPTGLPWREPRAWLISCFFALQSGLFYAVATWLVARYAEAGLSLLRSNALFSLLMLCGVPSAFLLPWLAQRFGIRYQLLLLCALVATLCLGMLTFMPRWLPEFWAIMLGLALSGSFAMALVLPLYEADSPLAVSRWTAMMLCAGYCMASFSPILIGMGRDLAGSYQPPFMVLTALALLMSGLAWRLHSGASKG